jgi:competence protein ComEC
MYLIAGIAAGLKLVALPVVAVITAIATAVLYLHFRLKGIVLLPIAAIIGFWVAFSAVLPVNVQLDELARDETVVEISGRVSSVAKDEERNIKYAVLDGYAFESEDSDSVINDKIRLRVYTDRQMASGDMVVVKGKLVLAQGKTNPADFDRRSYLLAKNQHYIMYATELSVYGNNGGIDTMLYRVSDGAEQILYDVLEQREASIMCGMLLGDSDLIETDITNLYRRTGIYHVIAISGLHIMLLGGMLLRLLWFIKVRFRGVAVTLFLICYCILTGCSVSAVRAVMMFGVFTVGEFFYRDYDVISSASFVAVILLLFRPFYLLDIGFQYSFLAVFAIGFTGELMLRYKDCGKVIDCVAVNIAVDAVTKIVNMFYYYYINVWTIVANFMLVPLMSIAAAIGFVVIVLGFVSLKAAATLAVILSVLLKVTEAWCRIFVGLPLSYVVTGKPMMFALLAFVLLFTSVYLLLSRRKIKALLIAVPMYVLIIVANKYALRNGLSRVTFLDVGQGDCAVGIFKDYCFVVDGGGLPLDTSKDGKGKRVLLPYLMSNGADKIDAVFVSHMDIDHAGGIAEIIGSINIDGIYISPNCEKNTEYYDIMEAAEGCGVPVTDFTVGDVLMLNSEDYMECVYSGNNISSNDSSMVNRLVSDYGSVLFTGDIEAEAERDICDEGIDISADILKIAHHGSKTSSGEEFLKAVNPLVGVISAKKSVYGHPNKEVTDRLDEMQIPYYVTDECGAISFELGADGIRACTYLQASR